MVESAVVSKVVALVIEVVVVVEVLLVSMALEPMKMLELVGRGDANDGD